NDPLEQRLDAVFDALEVQASKTTFAVGGLVHLGEGSHATLRWDTEDPNPPPKVSFPATSSAAFAKFLKDAKPATFGLNGQAVLDETYRKAGMMNADRFCTSFNLSEWGIMETVTNALIYGSHGGIRAELYNVNLAVRHQGREVIFDWASKSSTGAAIQFAAFFFDCEHEVLQVTAGHRIALAYNLYWADRVSCQPGLIEPEQLAFYPALKDLFSFSDFLPDGGLVGFKCAHAYPHRSNAMADKLQGNLKGIDMLIYRALRQLVGPSGEVVVTDTFKQYEKKKKPGLDCVGAKPLHGPFLAPFDDDNDDYPTEVNPGPEEIYTWDIEAGYSSRWLLREERGGWEQKHVHWLNHHLNYEEENREIAIGYVAYGNEPSMGCLYSATVIIATLRRG
ncbi:hypothetical protein QBC38DRAFT_530161, partial [Podospora fimiseda]